MPETIFSRRQALAAGLAASVTPLSAQPKPVKIGIIGLGGRARRHLTALKPMSEARITALSDIQPDRMEDVNRGIGGHATQYIDYRELIADKNVEVVVIAAPNFLHAPMALAAIRAGKDVLVEKPIGINFEEARELAREAGRLGRIVGVGMQRRYYSGDKKISEIVASGRIGKIQLISLNEFRGDWNPRTWVYTDPKTGNKAPWRHLRETAGSSLLEYSVHSYAFIYSMLMSPVVKVSATGAAVKYPERTTRDVVAVIADFKNAARLQHSYCGFARGAKSDMSIIGDQGFLQWDRKTLLAKYGEEKPVTSPLPGRVAGENAEREMYKEFLEAVRTRKKHRLNPAFALEPSKIAYAADISIRENRIVTDKDFS